MKETTWRGTGGGDEDRRDLYPSLNVMRVIKSAVMKWSENVARVGERRGA